jgi:hypothetical protein
VLAALPPQRVAVSGTIVGIGSLFAGGTHFTCFTGIKVQILTQLGETIFGLGSLFAGGAQFTCFASTKVQILTELGV